MKLVWEWMEIKKKKKSCKAALFGAARRGNERVRLRMDWQRETVEGGEKE